MKKVFFSMVLAFMALMNVDAQDVQLATLQKTDGTQVFYGADAFKEAMEAADHGDVVTLTAGTFNSTNITKAVSIYGAGYETIVRDNSKLKMDIVGLDLNKYPTRLNGDIIVALDLINGQPAEGLYIEGIYSNHSIWTDGELVAATFVKCRFQDFNFWKDAHSIQKSTNCNFFQCRFAGWLEFGESQMITVNNCLIQRLGGNTITTTYIQNSIIFNISSEWKGVMKNCIIYTIPDTNGSTAYHAIWNGSGGTIHSNSSVYYTFLGPNNALNDVILKESNWLGHENWIITLFGEDMRSYNDTSMYELTDEAKTTYVGTDGKEIGIYGGTTPFSSVLTIPRVVKKDIATETVDGKLKVDIKVETGDSSL